MLHVNSGWVVGLALRRESAIAQWRRLCGPTDSLFAKETYPNWYTIDCQIS
jgi:nucleoside diphosphate kinase